MQVGETVVDIVGGSITELPERFDFLVSSDDNYLSHGGGVSEAIWAAAGPELAAYVAANRVPLRLGSVFATPAGRLDAGGVLHAVTIDFDANRTLAGGGARALYAAVFDAALKARARSIALPLLGARSARLSVSDSVAAFLQAVEARADEWPALVRIALVLYGGDFAAHATWLEDGLRRVETLDGLGARAKRLGAVELDDGPRAAASDVSPLERAIRLLLAALKLLYVTGVGADAARVAPGDTPAGLLDVARRRFGGEERRALARFEPLIRNAIAAGNRASHAMLSGVADRRLALAEIKSGIVAALEFVEGLGDAQPVAARPAAGEPGAASAAKAAAPRPEAASAEPLAFEPAETRRSAPAEPLGFAPAEMRPCASAEPLAFAPAETVAAAPTDAPGAAHVRRLHDLFLRTLGAEDRAALVQDLRAEGYRGGDEDCLLECCVRRDPAELLRSWLTPRQLRKAIEDLNGEARPESSVGLVEQLLERLGFPGAQRPLTLDRIEAGVKRAQAEVSCTDDLARLRGLVTNVGAQLEFACRVLATFLCRRVFNEPAETRLLQLGVIKRAAELRTMSLGRWLDALDALSKDLQAATGGAAEEFRRQVPDCALAPRDMGGLAGGRNEFVHYRDWAQAESPTKARRKAAAFFERTLQLLGHWMAPERSLFPVMITVEEIRFDRWGRRTAIAKTPAGCDERIFSDLPLRPGEVYLMHATTNPFRIDPILVPAGDLGGGV